MPNNGTTPKQYVSLESLSIFLEKIKTAYKTNTSNANEKFPVHYAETAGQLDHSIVFKDESNNVIGTWGAGDSEIVLTVTGGGSLPSGVTILKFKGVKPTRAALDNLAAEDGDVWIIESDNSEYVWVPAIPAEGEEGQEGYKPAVDAHWEQLGATIDLSSYVTKAEMNFVTTEDINALFVEPEPEPEPEPDPELAP